MKYLAHSENENGEVQLLDDHIRNVAELAKEFASKFDAGDWGYAAGLLHDLGKFSDQYQKYIRGEAVRGGDHSSLGAIKTLNDANILAFPVRGHHGGLENRAKLLSSLRSKKEDSAVADKLERAKELLSEEIRLDSLALPSYLHEGGEERQKRGVEFFLRMVFSSLVDADSLDTEAHFRGESSSVRGNYPALPKLWEEFKQDQSELISGAEDSKLNKIRGTIYQQCLTAAGHRQGFFSLTVPTGGGKTRSGMGFALKHAMEHDMDRVIVVIPYTSIIEQTVDTYRDIFSGNRSVLEHHSGIVPSEYPDDHARWWELAAENWDAPVVVTTSVQFFDSLYANNRTRCRKLHNVVNSVVILDEVQTLPEERLEPILDGLKELVDHYGTTIVFSTATQPAFSSKFKEDTEGRLDLPKVREITDNPRKDFSELKRVRYRTGNEARGVQTLSWKEVAEQMAKNKQAMAVTNTREDARRLYENLQAESEGGCIYHLSSNLCGAHRRQVLSEVKERLKNGSCCLLATTQVIEAGVDIDFPAVMRAVGPLDRIVQAAGRCNRENKLDQGNVTLFEPKDGGMPPGAYKSGADTALAMLNSHRPEELHNPETYAEYFSKLYQAVELDSENTQKKREKLRYEDVAEGFNLIDQKTVSVAVPWDKQAEKLLREIEKIPEERIGRGIQRKLQPCFVDIYPYRFEEAESSGMCVEVTEDLWRWEGSYHKKLGLTFDPPGKDELRVG